MVEKLTVASALCDHTHFFTGSGVQGLRIWGLLKLGEESLRTVTLTATRGQHVTVTSEFKYHTSTVVMEI